MFVMKKHDVLVVVAVSGCLLSLLLMPAISSSCVGRGTAARRSHQESAAAEKALFVPNGTNDNK